jgi:hypothetical protein
MPLATQDNVTATAAATLSEPATLTPTPNPLLPAPLKWDVIVSDPFTSNVNRWPTLNNANDNCSVSSMELQNSALLWTLDALKGNWCTYVYYPGVLSVSDFDTNIEVKRNSGSGEAGFGIGFRIIDADNYYAFFINLSLEFIGP